MGQATPAQGAPRAGKRGREPRLGSFKVALPGGFAVSGTGMVGMVMAGVIVLLGVLLVPRFWSSDAIYAEPSQQPGTNGNPFMPPVGNDQRNVTPPQGAGGTFTGATSGLYGGTLNNSTCDRQAMITFLQANPDKGAAWAEVQGISQTDLPRYISRLTPVLLRSDTSVTNHGFHGGHATTLHSVLQAGTAVLVDAYGVPRSRCYCGNPLTPSVAPTTKRYAGPTWSGFSPAAVTTITPAATEITEFTLVNPYTQEVIYRPAGTAGEQDHSTTPTRTPQTPAQTPSQVPAQQPDIVPAGFVGTWSGSVTQDNYARSPYSATIQITGGGIGQTVATGEYPTLGCQVHWTLKQATSDEIVVRETVDSGSECVNVDVTLTLQPDGTMRYLFEGGSGRAVLQRVS